MAISKRLPTNTNLFQANKFKLVLGKTPIAEYFCQEVNLPSVAVPPVEHNNPFNRLWVTGVNTDYSELELSLLVDEELKVWQEIHEWMTGYSFPRHFEEYETQKQIGIYTDASILIMTNANVPKIRFNFTHLFPVSHGALTLTVKEDGMEQVILPVSFRYDTYEMVRIE